MTFLRLTLAAAALTVVPAFAKEPPAINAFEWSGRRSQLERQERLESREAFQSVVKLQMLPVPHRRFYLAGTEVTRAQWKAVMASCPSRSGKPDLPVERVTWEEAMAFCRRLTELDRAAGRLPEGYVYTLPTEEQWEYACRAGSREDFAGPLDELAWYGKGWLDNGPFPVATKKPNAWGFYDMHGNVWEWCLDEENESRFLRGGSWRTNAEYCKAGARFRVAKGYRSSYLGFRPAAVHAEP